MERTETISGAEAGRGRPTTDSSSQTESRKHGHGCRLSKVNLFTLLSLWMELFPGEQPEENPKTQIRTSGLVVVQDSKVVGLHRSGADLHAGQAAIIQHGPRLADCQLYFSRRPCATCLKMIINAGVKLVSFWPGDPEVSMVTPSSCHDPLSGAALDAVATQRLKSNSRAHICVQLQPLQPGLLQFVTETSRDCEFMQRITEDDPGGNAEQLYNRGRTQLFRDFSAHFLPGKAQQHQDILTHMGLENFCTEPYFSTLRHSMRELVQVLAAVAAGVPEHHYGFYGMEPSASLQQDVSQDVARHCIIQASLLAYRTEDPKVGVGAVIWAKGPTAGCSGTGSLSLVGCGYNAYPAGSQYAEYPQMDDKQEDRLRRKYRYIVHAEQNALTFRTRDIRLDELNLLFVTKCPCDECVPLIRGAGVSHIYTSDLYKGRDKGDISYLRFSSLKNISKFTWQRSPDRHLTNGCTGKHGLQADTDTSHGNKRQCTNTSRPSVS